MGRPYQQSNSKTQAVGFGRLEALELPNKVAGHQPRIHYVMRQAKVAQAIQRDEDNPTFAREQIPTLLHTANGNYVLRLNATASKTTKKGSQKAKNSLIITPNGRVVYGQGTQASNKEYLPPGSLDPSAIKTLYQSGLEEMATSKTGKGQSQNQTKWGDALFGSGHYYMPQLNKPNTNP